MAVSTVVRPVTQTEAVAVNSESTRLVPCPDAVEIGRARRAATAPMIAAKMTTASRAGEKRAARARRS